MNLKKYHMAIWLPDFRLTKPNLVAWLPSRGNVLFTLVMIAVLLWAQSAGAVPFRADCAASTGTIAYQGRLADSSGNPLTSTLAMSFRLYSAVTGGAPLWTEQWSGPNGVKVSDGLFNVMLGSLTPIAQSVITGNANLFLGITVGTDDEMTPRVQLGSVPFAMQALSVPDGSITTAKIADGAVTQAKFGSGNGLSITGDITATGNINIGGTLAGPKSFWTDYRPYIRFMKQDGATDAAMCPEGGVPLGVTSPLRSLTLKTGNDIAQAAYPRGGSCVNIHKMAPCGTIIGNHYPYAAESCTTDFSDKWAPFLWSNGESTHDVTTSILGSGIGCFDLKYTCVNLNP